MVRVNLVPPRELMDQHLVAEYVEIMMLVGHTKKYPSLDGIPETYRLGEGHIKFFKNKLGYLKKRHELISREMKRRGFRTDKKLDLKGFGKEYFVDWVPGEKDFKVIRKRLREKINMKRDWYRYSG
ncbi:MAG: pyrimidine dimer DNA glycosylase/endonuclease V [Nanoarchaeota archaeon]|nr:pyrimidine dimer DNA glycosylase/endonuclease V [Nanoarchaeota archaeon]